MSREPQDTAQPDPTDDRLRDAHGQVIETVALTPDEEKARKRRNIAIALGLVGFIALIFVVTVMRMTANYGAGA